MVVFKRGAPENMQARVVARVRVNMVAGSGKKGVVGQSGDRHSGNSVPIVACKLLARLRKVARNVGVCVLMEYALALLVARLRRLRENVGIFVLMEYVTTSRTRCNV